MQEIIVAAIVIYAVFVVSRRYAPKPVRQFVRTQSVNLATRMGWHTVAAKISMQAEAGASCGDGCGSCGNCSTSTPSAKQSTSISVEALKRTIAR